MPELIEYWIDLRSASRSHLRVRLVALLGAALFMASFALAGGGGPVSWTGLVVMGALVAFQPTTLMPVVFVIFAIGSWWGEVAGPWHWALLPAAVGLLLVHASAALAASVPPQAPVPASVVRLYAARVGLVVGLTALAWLLAALLAGVSTTAGGALPGIVGLALLVAALVAYLWPRRSPTRTDADS